MKIKTVRSEKGVEIAAVNGVPTNPNAGEEVQGSIKIVFDLSHGTMLSYNHRQVRLKNIGGSETRSKVRRNLVIERVKSILDETKTPDPDPEPKKPASKPSKD